MKNLNFNGFDCVIETLEYRNGGTAIELSEAKTGEPIAIATVWVEGLKEDEVAIKDYSENSGMLLALVANGIVTAPHREVNSGFVTIPICKLKK